MSYDEQLADALLDLAQARAEVEALRTARGKQYSCCGTCHCPRCCDCGRTRAELRAEVKRLTAERDSARQDFADELGAVIESAIENATACERMPGLEDVGRLRRCALGYVEEAVELLALKSRGVRMDESLRKIEDALCTKLSADVARLTAIVAAGDALRDEADDATRMLAGAGVRPRMFEAMVAYDRARGER